MIEETFDNQADTPQLELPEKGNKKKLLIIIAGATLILLAGGFLAYKMFYSVKEKASVATKGEAPGKKEVFVLLAPFIMNLAEQGRFLKLSVQFELANESYQQIVLDKTPKLRDAIIVLISSKDSESISNPEGKFQLKDEILLRANQIMGTNVFKNLYFTEFLMQ